MSLVDHPTRGEDRIPIYGWFFDNPGVPPKGQIEFTMTQRIKRTDGRAIYAGGARKVVEIGDAEQQDPEIRAAVKLAYKALAQAEEGAAFDEAVWEQRRSEERRVGKEWQCGRAKGPGIRRSVT